MPADRWTFKLKNAGNGYIVWEGDEAMVCDVFMTNESAIALNRARLISASPDLLEACKVAYSTIWAIRARLGVAVGEREEAAVRLLDERLEKVKAAIFKAEGKPDAR